METIAPKKNPAAAAKVKAPFKLLRGHRILLKRPVKKESAIQLDAATEQALELEMMRKWTNLEIYAVGKEVSDMKVGDTVYVSPESIQNAALVHIDEEIYLMITEYDVSIVW